MYFLLAKEQNLVKIGTSKSDVNRRIGALQTACPFDLELVRLLKGGLYLEQQLHHLFREYRHKREWYQWSDPISKFVELSDEIQVKQEQDQWTAAVRAVERLSSQNESQPSPHLPDIAEIPVQPITQEDIEIAEERAVMIDPETVFSHFCLKEHEIPKKMKGKSGLIYAEELLALVGRGQMYPDQDWRAIARCKDQEADVTPE